VKVTVWMPPSASEGVHENSPVPALNVAPGGSPGPMESVTVSSFVSSASVAVTVKWRFTNAVASWSPIGLSVGAALPWPEAVITTAPFVASLLMVRLAAWKAPSTGANWMVAIVLSVGFNTAPGNDERIAGSDVVIVPTVSTASPMFVIWICCIATSPLFTTSKSSASGATEMIGPLTAVA
jgi:hypothetical protein